MCFACQLTILPFCIPRLRIERPISARSGRPKAVDFPLAAGHAQIAACAHFSSPWLRIAPFENRLASSPTRRCPNHPGARFGRGYRSFLCIVQKGVVCRPRFAIHSLPARLSWTCLCRVDVHITGPVTAFSERSLRGNQKQARSALPLCRMTTL